MISHIRGSPNTRGIHARVPLDEVAAAGYAACMNGEVITVPGVINLAATLAARAAPKWLLRRVAGAFTRKAL